MGTGESHVTRRGVGMLGLSSGSSRRTHSAAAVALEPAVSKRPRVPEAEAPADDGDVASELCNRPRGGVRIEACDGLRWLRLTAVRLRRHASARRVRREVARIE
jgi:hypothetical protein